MIKQWQSWSEKWETLSKRERFMLLLVVAVAPSVLIFLFLFEPALKTAQRLPDQISVLEAGVSGQEKILTMLQGQQVKDPNIKARQELQKLRSKLAEDKAVVQKAANQLIAPDKMLKLLQSVLDGGDAVRLLQVNKLPMTTRQLGAPSPEQGEEEATAKQATLFVHPFELELEGSYQGVYDYLQRLEQLEQAFFWDSLEYVVDEFPTAKVRIRVHTLSSEAGWLGA